MARVNERHKVVINKFHELLRSGKDYSVKYMYNEAGKVVYIEGWAVQKIIRKYYKDIITQEMIDFVNNFKPNRTEEIQEFSDKFNVCKRESILLIRYVRRRDD